MKKQNIPIFLAICLLTALTCLDISAMALAITPIAHALNIPLGTAQWIIASYFITFASIVIIGGRLGDLWGEKNLLLVGMLFFIVGSLIGSMAHGLFIIIIARILQAIGAGIAYPNNMSTLLKTFPQEKHGSVLGIYASVVGLSVAIGPIVGGLLTHYLSWRWIFLINIPLGLICLITIAILQKKQPTPVKKSRLDLLGTLTLTIAIVALIYAIDKLNLIYQQPIIIILLLLISGLAFYLFFFFAKRVRDPLVNFHLFRHYLFRYGLLQRFLVSCINSMLLFILGIYFIKGLHYSIQTAAFLYLPYTFFLGIFSPYAGRLVDKVNIHLLLIGAIILFFSGFLLFFFGVNFYLPLPILIFSLLISGGGYSILYPGLLTVTMRPIEATDKGVASGIFFMINLTGGAAGAAIAGLLLNDNIAITAPQIAHSTAMLALFAMALIFIMLIATIYSCRALGGTKAAY